MIRHLRSEGLAILLVEQNLRAALLLTDRNYVLSKGKICFCGTSAELEHNDEVKKGYLSV